MKKSKKILIVTQYFYPEDFKVNDIAFDLVNSGVDVTVLTAIPNYPGGVFFKGYGYFSKRKECVNGVNVIRVPVVPRGGGSSLRLIMNYFSFVMFSFIPAIKLALGAQFDSVFVHEVSPVTVGIPALIVKKIQKIPMFFWVLDLWPETLTAMSGITSDFIINPLTSLVKSIYNNCERILISSRAFEQSILDKGDYGSKLYYFPNWAESLFDSPKLINDLPKLPDGFKIMYAGNIGDAQNLDVVIAAATKLKDYKDIKWIIIGAGRRLKWLENSICQNGLKDSVYILGRFPIDYMPSFYSKADAMLLSLKDDYIFKLTVPARLQSYMASAKPIISVASGESKLLIEDAKCGYAADSSDVDLFVKNVLKMYNKTDAERVKLGSNAYQYYSANFKKDYQIKKLKKILNI